MKAVKTLLALLAATLIFSTQALASQKIITFAANVHGEEKRLMVEKAGGKTIREFQILNAVVAVFDDSVKNAALYAFSGVINIEEDKRINWLKSSPASMNAVQLPSVGAILERIRSGAGETLLPDPSKPQTDDGEVPWGVQRVNAPAVWAKTQGEGVKIAVIDTGMDYTHPDLRPNYAGGYNILNNSSEPGDDNGHGTHVAGTIAAVRNGKGVVGIAPKVKLYAVKVLNAEGSGNFSDVIAGIEWAAVNKMDVANLSLGTTDYSQSLENIVAYTYNSSVTIVCAAGNDSGPVNYPAKYPQSIAVSALDVDDTLAYFSSVGPEISFIAPGTNITSTYPGGNYTMLDGTSMAAPHVAGLVALAISLGAKNPAEVKAMLTKASSRLALEENQQGAGMINAAKISR